MLISLSFKTQLTLDNIFFKYITSKGYSFQVEVFMLREFKMGYFDWRTGGLLGGVEENFELIDDGLSSILYLFISKPLILLSSDQYIASKISVDIEYRKLWLDWRVFVKKGRTY